MITISPALAIVGTYIVGAVGISLLFFRRRQLARPPIGTLNFADVAFALVAIAVVPYFYLVLPAWAAVGVAGAIWMALLSLLLGPVISSRSVRWGVVIGLIASDVAVGRLAGTHAKAFLLINDTVVMLVAVAMANLWGQSGLRLRNLGILAVGLTAYDIVATSRLTLMTDLMNHLNGVPLQPLIAWDAGRHGPLGVGLGDIVVAALVPLVLLKAFGPRAAAAGASAILLLLGALLAVIDARGGAQAFPAMAVVGPIVVALWVGAALSRRTERTTQECRMAWATGPADV